MVEKHLKYATIKHPTIEALVGGHYRYKEHKQALARFQAIKAYFVQSKDQPTEDAKNPTTRMWIKGFEVTQADAEKGFTGHFAEVTIAALPNGQFTLKAKKLERPVATHPQRKRVVSTHPNWGHPVMRAVKKQKLYPGIEAAQTELDLLHLEYPEVSIPGPGKLYIIIYEKRPETKRPTHKIALEIKAHPQGGFVIAARDNEKANKPLAKKAPEVLQSIGEETATPGAFASKVLLSKKTKRKNLGRPTTGLKKPQESE